MSTESTSGHRLLVLGGGPGGYPAAFLAADLGMQVTLVDERQNPGGVCLYVGCIPSKALLHAAKVLNEAREAASYGVAFAEPMIDLEKLRAWKDAKVVSKLTGGLGSLAKQRKVNKVTGRGRFIDANHVEVTDASGGGAKQVLEFDSAIIATGSRPAMPRMFDIKSQRVMDSTGALELRDIPKSMLVVGGGYIGLEMGTVYAALGSKVTVVEMLQGILPGADRDLADALHKQLTHRFSEILLNTRVTEVAETGDGVKVKLLGLDLKDPQRTFDRVLVSVGRIPNSQDIGLDKLGIAPDEKGFIQIDAQRRTVVPNIFAIGDVVGGVALAHKATHEGRVAVETIAGKPAAFDPAAIPAVVFTDPEVAWAGITETEALNKGIEHKVARFPWAASGRATTLGRSDGLTKLIVDPQSERVLGIGMCGVGAGDLIAEAALAVEMGATVTDLARTIHPHPTLSETIMEAAELYFGHCAHYTARK